MPMVDGVPGCLRVPGLASNFYVLNDRDGLYLIDAGGIGGRSGLTQALRAAGWEHLPIRGILVSHGHFDHILNVGRLARTTGAWIAGSNNDAQRFAGKPVVKGTGAPLAWGERFVFRLPDFEAFVPGRRLEDGDFLDLWGGLRVVALPGHTAGHLGFFSERHGILFCADLFASYGGFSHLPPAVFNEDGEEIRKSVRKALALNPAGILPHHADGAPSAEHLRRLKQLAAKVC